MKASRLAATVAASGSVWLSNDIIVSMNDWRSWAALIAAVGSPAQNFAIG
jgi:hypothetical protein